jgi:hypothetical protein
MCKYCTESTRYETSNFEFGKMQGIPIEDHSIALPTLVAGIKVVTSEKLGIMYDSTCNLQHNLQFKENNGKAKLRPIFMC